MLTVSFFQLLFVFEVFMIFFLEEVLFVCGKVCYEGVRVLSDGGPEGLRGPL